jgi:NAD+ synthase
MKGPDGEVIPPRVIDKPPTAELRENQKDEDSLPPYADLDVMLEMLIDKEASSPTWSPWAMTGRR